MSTYNILFLGASYGSLLATKMLFGGHKITLVCLPGEAEAINKDGARVRMPIKGRKDPVEIHTKTLPGKLVAAGPGEVNPADFDVVILAMQEPQYRQADVRALLDAVAKAKVPCVAIMNMPPLPYLKRIPGLDYEALKAAFTDPSVWDHFDPALVTLCSPDPQAIRPAGEPLNVLQVTLPTNFKLARFENEKYNEMMRQMEKEIDSIRYDIGGEKVELPVKLRVYDSLFVPLAKWPMLLAGNYRCITKDGMRTAQEAVNSDPEAARSVYDFVLDLCEDMGAAPSDMVPFEKYAAAAQSLVRPSSAARALTNGAPYIERTDKLVEIIAKQKGLSNPGVEQIVDLVDTRLAANRQKAK